MAKREKNDVTDANTPSQEPFEASGAVATQAAIEPTTLVEGGASAAEQSGSAAETPAKPQRFQIIRKHGGKLDETDSPHVAHAALSQGDQVWDNQFNMDYRDKLKADQAAAAKEAEEKAAAVKARFAKKK